MTPQGQNNPGLGIVFIILGMGCISINDMVIKQLSGDYPLHQMVFVRSAIGIVFSLVILQVEGGFRLLRTDRVWLHLLRGLCIVAANMAFFAALAVIPLADATALFFVAPLFITLLAIPVLGEPVGPPRLVAIVVGLAGVGMMMAPGVDWGGIPRWNLMLPVAAAACFVPAITGSQSSDEHLSARGKSAMTMPVSASPVIIAVYAFSIASASAQI